MMKLSKYAISPSYGVRAWKEWGNSILDIIDSNPYILCNYGVELPFQKAEEIAIEMNIPKDSENRIKAGISSVLLENSYLGHTCIPYDKLMDKVCNILEINQKSFDLALNSEIENQVLFEYIKKERKFLYFV